MKPQRILFTIMIGLIFIYSTACTSIIPTPTSTPSPTNTVPPTITPSPIPTQTPIPPTQTPEPTASEPLTPANPTDTPLTVKTQTLGSSENPIKMAIIDRPETSMSTLNELSLAVNSMAGIFFEFVVTSSFEETANLLCEEEVHLGELDTQTYLSAHEQGCVNVALIAEKNGSPFYTSQVVARSDSGITSLSDLVDASFCRPYAESFSSWLVPRMMLKAAGINPETDLAEIRDAGGYVLVIREVYNGECEAGSTYTDTELQIQDEYPDITNVISVIAESPQIPHENIGFRPDVPDDVQVAMINAFLFIKNYNNGQVLKDVFGWDGLFSADDTNYNPLRELMASAGVQP